MVGAAVSIGSTADTRYTDATVELGLTYVYRVTQVGATGKACKACHDEYRAK